MTKFSLPALTSGREFDLASSQDVKGVSDKIDRQFDAFIRDWNRGLKVMRFGPVSVTPDSNGNALVSLSGPASGFIWNLRRITVASEQTITNVTDSVVRPPNPAVGSPLTVTVPAGQTWRVKGVYATFTTGTETAARMLELQYADGTGVFATYPNPAPISVPSNTYTPQWGYALGQYDTVHTSRAAGLDDIPLPAGTNILVNATSLQADDAFTNVALYIEATSADNLAGVTVLRVADPAAGQPATFTVPDGETWIVRSAADKLTLGTENVDRMPLLNYLDSTGIFASYPAPGTINTPAASVTPTWGEALGQYESTHTTRAAGLNGLVLTGGMQVQFTAKGMAADDQISNAVISVEQSTTSDSTNGTGTLQAYRSSDGTVQPQNLLGALPLNDSWIPSSKSIFLMPDESVVVSISGLTGTGPLIIQGEAIEAPAEMMGKLL